MALTVSNSTFPIDLYKTFIQKRWMQKVLNINIGPSYNIENTACKAKWTVVSYPETLKKKSMF